MAALARKDVVGVASVLGWEVGVMVVVVVVMVTPCGECVMDWTTWLVRMSREAATEATTWE